MRVTCLSDRVRADALTGETLVRDLSPSEAGRSLEEAFSARPHITSPRGGVASFQVVVCLDQPTQGVELELQVGPFAREGQELDQAGVYYAWPCQLDEAIYSYDALLPLDLYRAAPAAARLGPLGARRVHVFWIDVPVPRETKPGVYLGPVVMAGGSELQIAIEVLSAQLPLRPRLTVDLNSYANRIPLNHPGLDLPTLTACEHSYYREAHDHRAVFHYLSYNHAGVVAEGYAPPLAGRGRNLRVADWSAFDRRFGPLFDGRAMHGSPGGDRPLPHWYLPFNYDWPADFAYFGTRGFEEEWVQVLAAFLVHAQERGWTETHFELFFNPKKRYRFFGWDGDESKSRGDREHFLHFGRLADRARRVAGAAGEQTRLLYRTDSSWGFLQDSRDEELGARFDLWVVHMGNFIWAREAVRGLQQRGCRVWPYGTTATAAYPQQTGLGLDARVLTAWRRKADGVILNWLGQGDDPDLDRATAFSMLYPARRFGAACALGSIRLRRVRLATETTDLLDLLESDGSSLVDAALGAEEEDWWSPTPQWMRQPPETMNNDMYGWQKSADPFAEGDSYAPALIREEVIARLRGR